jgi:tRNA (cmo5U34)-methyltransferase
VKDEVFTKKIEKKFEFDESVASVFDDMLSRSIPFYDANSALIIDLICKRQKEGLKVLDLGSSTAKFLLMLHNRMQTKMHLKGIDNSAAMNERAKRKIQAFGADITIEDRNILTYPYEREDIVVANYTLQFIRPIERLKLVQKIAHNLNDEGVFFFCEKVIFDNKRLDKEIIDVYYDYKKAQGYSEYEIAQKREALENVLVPFSIEENIKMCKEAGFREADTIFQWANFVTFMARI